jgi:hypothetical protein
MEVSHVCVPRLAHVGNNLNCELSASSIGQVVEQLKVPLPQFAGVVTRSTNS